MSKNGLNKQETHILDENMGSIPAPSTLKSSKLASNEAFFIFDKKTVPKKVPVSPTFRKRFLKHRLPYKLPTIIRPSNGEWFVKYFYEYPDKPGVFKEKRVKDGVNYIKDIEEKESAILDLCEDIKYALEKLNYSPFNEKTVIRRGIRKKKAEIADRQKLMSLTDATDWIKKTKKSKNKSDKYLREFTWIDNNFIPWCAVRNLITIDQPTIDDIELFLYEKLEEEEWAPRTYNNKISIITTFFNYLTAKRKLKVNPIQPGNLERIDDKAEKNKYYDQETLDLIFPSLQKEPELRRYFICSYYTCARGTELRALRIKDIDINIKKIVIRAEIGKTGAYVGKRNIPLCSELNELIAEENIKSLPADWYVFGKNGVPGPDPIYHNFFSNIYFDIKKDLNIDFKYTIYGIKHTRVVDLLVAGFDPIKVMHITGHTNWGSFQKYIRDLGAVMDKQLIGNTLKLHL